MADEITSDGPADEDGEIASPWGAAGAGEPEL